MSRRLNAVRWSAAAGRPAFRSFRQPFVQQRDDRGALGDTELASDLVNTHQQVGRNLQIDEARCVGIEWRLVEIVEPQLSEWNVGCFAGSLHAVTADGLIREPDTRSIKLAISLLETCSTPSH